MILLRASGTLLPNAMNDKPITVSGIPKVSPMIVTIQSKTYEKTPIHKMELMKVIHANIRNRSRRTSGMVRVSKKLMGSVNNQNIRLKYPSGITQKFSGGSRSNSSDSSVSLGWISERAKKILFAWVKANMHLTAVLSTGGKTCSNDVRQTWVAKR